MTGNELGGGQSTAHITERILLDISQLSNFLEEKAILE